MILPDEHLGFLRAAFGDRELTVVPLSGGLHARCYRVTSASFDYAVRMPAPDEGEFRLTCRTEQRVLARVAEAGIAPPVAPSDPALGLVVTRFLDGARPWLPEDARRPANIARIASRLRALHAVELEVEPYACVAAAQAYGRAAASRHSLSAEQRGWRDELQGLASSFELTFPATTPCHNDLVASNILDDGELWLVDFEYTALSSPILDLASLAGLNDFDAAQRARLVAAYYGDGPVPFDMPQLETTIRLIRLLAYFWALAYGEASTAAGGFAAFADALAAVLR